MVPDEVRCSRSSPTFWQRSLAQNRAVSLVLKILFLVSPLVKSNSISPLSPEQPGVVFCFFFLLSYPGKTGRYQVLLQMTNPNMSVTSSMKPEMCQIEHQRTPSQDCCDANLHWQTVLAGNKDTILDAYGPVRSNQSYAPES